MKACFTIHRDRVNAFVLGDERGNVFAFNEVNEHSFTTKIPQIEGGRRKHPPGVSV